MLDFVIIGAQKGGSTYLQKCLQEHPGIFIERGENRAFEDPEYGQDGIQQLEKTLRNVPAGKVRGIKRPSYLGHPEWAERIALYAPHTKLIATLRSPVERAISAYYHYMRLGLLPIVPVENGMAAILEGEYRDRFPASEEIVEYGFYHRHIKHYLKLFSRDKLLLLTDVRVNRNRIGAVEELYGFLEVDSSYSPKLDRAPVNEGTYSLHRLRFLQLRNALAFTYDANRTKEYLRFGLLGRVLDRAFRDFDALCLRRILGGTMPVISDSLHKRLYDIYVNDISSLERFLGEDLSVWKNGGGTKRPSAKDARPASQ